MSHTSPAAKRRRDVAETCHYCEVTMTHNIPPQLGTDATIEHLNSRIAFPDGRPNIDGAIVIACRNCNERRAKAEQQEMGLPRLRELAGRWPGEYEHPATALGATS